jgi:ABC-type uncharacterized transport system involved in gliding motility auxiliary subunit
MSPRFRSSTRYGINTAIAVALAFGIVALIEAFSYRHAWRKDFTETARHSLSEQTVNLLKELEQPVKVTAFIRKASPAYEQARDLFELYEFQSNKMEIEIIDPDLNPVRAREADIGRYGPMAAIFEGAKGRETITEFTEERITNALIKVTRGEKKVVCFLTGHGEHALDNRDDAGLNLARELLENKNYEPRELMLIREEKVPADCAMVVVAGPKTDLTEPELSALDSYIKEGGRVLLLIDPETAPSLKPFLAKYGIVLGDDYVVDRLSRLFGADYLVPVPTTYSDHAITRNFNIITFFPGARSVSTGKGEAGVRTNWLAKTGEGSWAETDLARLTQDGEVSLNPQEDTPGPITLGVVSEIDAAEAAGKDEKANMAALVVYGDSDFATNARINLSGNADLFMNTVNWLAREEALVAIAPKESKFTPVVMTVAEGRLLFLVSVVALPGIALLAAVGAYVRRSRHP